MSNAIERLSLRRTAISAIAGLALSATALSSVCAEPLKSILFVNPLPQYPAWRLIGDCIADAAKAANIPETESGPTDGALNTTVMIQQIQQGIANVSGPSLRFPQLMASRPFSSRRATRASKSGQLYGAGGTESGADVNVGANFTVVGQIFAEAIAQREGPQNVGLMIQGPTGAGKAFSEAFTAAAEKTDNVKVIAVVNTNDDASKALDQASALLTAHPEINVIASHMGTATQGATAAIKAKGLVGKVVFVANGPAGGGREGLADGTVYKLMMQDLCNAGGQIIDALAKIGEGETVPAQLDVGVKMFSEDGIQEYLDKGWQ